MPKFQKSLFIALGGSGAACLRQLRRQLRSEFGTYRIPVFEYLVLDTDPDTKASLYRRSSEQITDVAFETILQPEDDREYLYLGVNQNKLTSFLNKTYKPPTIYDHTFNWLRNDVTGMDRAVLETGAGGARTLGKLALTFNHFDPNGMLLRVLCHKLRNLNTLSESDPRMKVDEIKGRFEIEGTKISVYIIGSAAGGTGSGLSLELGYYIQWILESNALQGANVELAEGAPKLFLMMPDIWIADGTADAINQLQIGNNNIGGAPLMMAGAYAALAELNYFNNRTGGTFSFKKGFGHRVAYVPRWDSQGTDERVRREFAHRSPFSRIYLIGNEPHSSDTATHGIKAAFRHRMDALDTVANFIFYTIQDQAVLAGQLSIASNAALGTPPLAVGSDLVPINYSSLGVARVTAGKTQFHQWAAYHHSVEFVEHLLQPAEKCGTTFEGLAEFIPESYRLELEMLYTQLASAALRPLERRLREKAKHLDDFSNYVRQCAEELSEDYHCFGSSRELAEAKAAELQKIDKEKELFEQAIEKMIYREGISATRNWLKEFEERQVKRATELGACLSNDRDHLRHMDSNQKIWFLRQANFLDFMGANKPKSEDQLSGGENGVFRKADTYARNFLALLELPSDMHWIAQEGYEASREKVFEYSYSRQLLGEIISNDFNQTSYASAIGQRASLKDKITRLRQSYEYCDRALYKLHQKVILAMQAIYEKRKELAVSIQNAISDDLVLCMKRLLEIDPKEKKGLKCELDLLVNLTRAAQDKPEIVRGAGMQVPSSLARKPTADYMGQLLKTSVKVTNKPFWKAFSDPRSESLNQAGFHLTRKLAEEGYTEPLPEAEPSLSRVYGDDNGAKMLIQDLRHLKAWAEPRIRTSENAPAGARVQENSIKRWLRFPATLSQEDQKIIRDEMRGHVPLANIQAVDGIFDIVLITMVDDFAVAFLNYMDDWENKYDRFQFPGFVRTWDKGEDIKMPGRRKVQQINDSYYAVVEALLTGTIYWDDSSKQFMSLQLSGNIRHGTEDDLLPVFVGTSLSEVFQFFEDPNASAGYVDPLDTLKSQNERRLSDHSLISKMIVLTGFYQGAIVPVPEYLGKPEREVIDHIRRRFEDKRDSIIRHFPERNDEFRSAVKLLERWIHSFIIPIPSNHKEHKYHDETWLPVLAQAHSDSQMLATFAWWREFLHVREVIPKKPNVIDDWNRAHYLLSNALVARRPAVDDLYLQPGKDVLTAAGFLNKNPEK